VQLCNCQQQLINHSASKALETEAKSVISKIDEAVKPCENFYQFACGKYIRETEVPRDKAIVMPLDVLGDHLREQLHDVMNKSVVESDIVPYKMVKYLYRACMDTELIEKLGLEPMRELHKAFGGWPILDDGIFDEKRWSWQKTVKEYTKYGFQLRTLIETYVQVDRKNTSRSIIYVDQALLGLDQEFLLQGAENPIVQAYLKYQQNVAILFGGDKNRVVSESRQVLDFEMKLAEILLPRQAKRNMTKLYNPMTIRELQKVFSLLDWVEYYNVMMPPESQVTEDEVVVVADVGVLCQMQSLLRETDKR